MPGFDPVTPALGLALIRPMCTLALLPLAGMKQLPFALQATFALALAVFIFPRMPELPPDTGLLMVVILAFGEAVTGFAMGFSLATAIAAARLGGDLIGTAMGLGFSALIDPEHGTAVPIVGQFFSLTMVALFVSLDGPVTLMRIVSESFTAVPFGSGVSPTLVPLLIRQAGSIFGAGIGLALPVLVTTFGVQFGFAVLARLAPQLNLFAVGFPATLIAGLLVVAVAFPSMGSMLTSIWRSAFSATAAVAGLP